MVRAHHVSDFFLKASQEVGERTRLEVKFACDRTGFSPLFEIGQVSNFLSNFI